MAGESLERRGMEAYGVGVVEDNRDPERKGRIKVRLGPAAGGASAWLPMLVRHAGDGHGPWALPEVGTQTAYILTNIERCEGVALGFVRDESRRPPEGSAKKATGSKVIQTRKHRIEIIEEDGKEEIRAESAGGKMRVVISKDGGINLVNELGDINIKCRNLRAASDGGLAMQAGGAVRLRTEDEFKIKADGKAVIESGKEAKVKGQNVRLHGSRGVSAEGKQVAAEGDKVLGFDVHQMEVPSANGTQIVPLPHPFMGKLKDKLAKDVKMGSRKCAVKGSVARHDDAAHMQLPGTIKFQQSPKKEGEVTGGTSAKVKIDGKEAAVIGSTVTTCNDIGARDNSTVMAAGASMPMPTIINPLNAEEWKREREEADKKEPAFQSVKWTKTSAEEGEEVELTATVRDIADGNMVTLQVFPEGKGPEDGAAYAKLPVTVKDGTAGARWSYRADRRDMPLEENPRFIFTAHSAWCNFAKSSNTLEVRLKRPEITKAEWHSFNNQNVIKEKIDNKLTLYTETKDIDNGKTVTFEIFESSQNLNIDNPLKVLFANVSEDKASVEFNFNDLMPPLKIDEALYRYYKEHGEDIPREQFEFLLDDYDSEIDSPYKEKPKFIFVVKVQKCKNFSSKTLELSKDITVTVLDSAGKGEKNAKVSLKEPNGKEHKFVCGEDGIATFEDLIPGNYHVKIERKEK